MGHGSSEGPWPWEKPRRRWPLVLGLGCAAAVACVLGPVLAVLLAIGVGAETGLIPDTRAVPGDRLPAWSLRFLREQGLLEEGETVIYFYSDGFLDIESDGSFFTDRHVVRYTSEPGEELESWIVDYPEIESISTRFGTGFMENSDIDVHLVDGGVVSLSVCNDEGGDREFDRLLRGEWAKLRDLSAPEEPR